MGSPRAADAEAAKGHKREHHKDGDNAGVKLNDRGCTDILCCLMFVAMIVVMVGITGYALGQGDLERIATKYDMQGQKCVEPTEFKLFTRLLPRKWTKSNNLPGGAVGAANDPTQASWAVCVDKCPMNGTTGMKWLANTQYPANSGELTSEWSYDTYVIAGFCIPNLENSGYEKQFMEQLDKQAGGFGKYMHDLKESWKLILVMAFASMIVTLIYLFLLRWITKPLLYVSLFLILIFGGLVTAWCFRRMGEVPQGTDDYKYAQAGGWVAGIITLLYVVFLCCNWSNIAIGASIMEAAGEFVSCNPRIAIVPLVCYLLFLPITLWYAAVNVYIYSLGTPKYVPNEMFAQLEPTEQSGYMFWIFMFGFFWITAFIIAILQFTIAATTALWFFQGANSDSSGSVSVCKGIWWAFRYHLGSLAFGSFLIAVVTMLKVVFEYYAKKVEKMNGDNPAVKMLLCIARCVIWCLDCCVKFISENAYIQVAINGVNFCTGAKNGFFMIIGNPGMYAAMNVAGWIMTAIGKGVILGVCVYGTMLLAHENVLVATPNGKIQQPFVPAFVVLLVAYLVSALFISIFDFACLTILQSFITAKEVSGPGKKVNAPKSLEKFLRQSGETYKDDGDDKPADSGAGADTNKVE